MTTDRTQPARPPALNDRSSAAPAERRDGSAFAALLGAQTPAPGRREAAQPRDAAPGHDQPRDAAVRQDQPRDAATGHDPAGAQPGGSSETPVQPEATAPAPAAQPVVIPPFVATLPTEAPAAPVVPALPVSTAPLFMLAPEAVAVAAVVPAAPVAPEVPAGVTVAATPQTGLPAAPTSTVPAQPATTPVQGQVAPAGEQPAVTVPQAPVAQAPAQETELPAEPAVAADAPAASEPHAAAPARVATTPEPAPAAAAPAAQAPTVEPFAPASAQPLSGPVAPERTVPMHRAPAAVATLLHVAAERGITHAKMALRPVELGGIEIRLQASAAGIAAQVIADSPEAAKLLAQAGDDLRRALEAREVTLISLEVSTTADHQQRQSARGEWSDLRDAGPTSSNRTAGDAEDDAAPAPTNQTVIELPGGLLVDVLA